MFAISKTKDKIRKNRACLLVFINEDVKASLLDENGCVSRLLATYILKAYSYDLKFKEEFYDKNIDEYYN